METVSFSTPKRVHGTVIEADSVANGLAEETWTLIVSFTSVD
ncbi:MAG: hypothetical protein Q4C01_01645 [Clostridia bacterium]|nr:hypothetical protein [Clostridia bacterium]